MPRPSSLRHLTSDEARRVAISAQRLRGTHTNHAASRSGSIGEAPGDGPSTRHLMREARLLGAVQIDSVNVFARAHYMPLFSRLGPYPMTAFDALSTARHSGVFEYWAHVAAFVPIEDWPLWQWRMADQRDTAAREDSWEHQNHRFLTWLLDYVHDHGAVTSSDIEHERNVRRGPWWGWSDVKRGLERLFSTGELVVAGRRGFEREYTVPARAIPTRLREVELTRSDAQRALVQRAARSLGVFTVADLADYFRMKQTDTRQALNDLVEEGQITPVTVDSWAPATWIWTDTRVPRRANSNPQRAILLSPFDPLVWFRQRLERMFGFHYRIEIYTPAPKRVFGYYCLPFLLGDEIAGRVDLKSDRATGRLLVQAAWSEESAPDHTASALAATLREAASWQGLTDVVVAPRGNLAGALRVALS